MPRSSTARRHTCVADLAGHEGIALRLAGRSGLVWKLLDHGSPVEVCPRMRVLGDS